MLEPFIIQSDHCVHSNIILSVGFILCMFYLHCIYCV